MTNTETKTGTETGSTRTDQLWRQFLEARTIALQTLEIEDGIRAGRAWAEFLAAFVASPPIVPGQPQ
ncbi:MAG: hypothetical protein ACLP0B_08240 [Steroidobacteraceae bacterium]